jgi:hypothetical protein
MPLPRVSPSRWAGVAFIVRVVVVLVATTGACSSGGAAPTPPAVPTFSQLYDEIFDGTPAQAESGCWGSACHAPVPDPGVASVDFSTREKAYQSLIPRFADALLGVLTDDLDFLRMPKGRPRLSAAGLARIAAWLDAGARND